MLKANCRPAGYDNTDPDEKRSDNAIAKKFKAIPVRKYGRACVGFELAVVTLAIPENTMMFYDRVHVSSVNASQRPE